MIWRRCRSGLQKILRQRCRRLNYRQRLEFLNLPTLAFRRNRGDVTEVYKILTGKYDPTLPSILHTTLIVPPGASWGNPLKSCTYRLKYNLCKHNLIVRVISLWNSFPTHVITADSVDSFQNMLDKFWATEVSRFDYRANLSGSGFARCFYILCCVFVIMHYSVRCGHRGLRPMPIVARLCLCLTDL